MNPDKIVIITDLDNTIYDWVDSFAPSFRGMLHALADMWGEGKLDESQLIKEFRILFQKHGTLEYEAQADELPIFALKSKDEKKKINAHIFGAFRNVARGSGKGGLRLYPGCIEFFMWAYENNITLLALTNAPLRIAKRRLLQLGVNRFYSAIAGAMYAGQDVSKSDAEKRDDKQPSLFSDAISDFFSPDSEMGCIYLLELGELKPNITGYKRLLADWGKSASRVYVLGDSLQKDLMPAKALGAITVWGRYGTVVQPENVETLLGITPWNPAQIANAYGSDFTPDYVIDDIRELCNIVSLDCGLEPLGTPELI